jgi:hypothetical protein
MQQMQMVNFVKNVSMAGGALVLFYAFNQLQGEAGLSITDPLFGRPRAGCRCSGRCRARRTCARRTVLH